MILLVMSPQSITKFIIYYLIQYLSNTDINRPKWDHCIQTSCFETIYGYSWYLDLVADNWDGLVEDDYKAVFPLTWKKKFGIEYLIQPVLTQQLGVFSPDKKSMEDIQVFLNHIPSRFRHMDICLNASNEFASGKYKMKERVNYELDLKGNFSEIAGKYSENTKRNIKKSSQMGLTLRKITLDEYIGLKKKSEVNAKSDEHYVRLKSIFTGILNTGKAEIWGAFSGESICASVFWALSNSRTIYLNSVSNATGKEKRAMFLLVNDFIERNAGQEFILDFEGSNIPGVARFFAGFGAEMNNYLRIRRSSFPIKVLFR